MTSPRTSKATSAVVTGGAQGIGRAIAEALVARGHAVVVSDVNGVAAKKTADEIGAAAGIALDVRNEAEHESALAAALRQGPLAVWVNNAGVGVDGRLTDQESDTIAMTVDVNLSGVIWGCRIAARALVDSGNGGDIINTASLSGHGPVPGLSVYAATKAAVVSLTMSLDSELRDSGVRVHAICPDGVSTALVDQLDPDGQAAGLIHSGGRLLTPAEVAGAAVGMLGTRRVVRTLPAWRGAVMRGTSLAPSVVMRLEPLMRAQGRRAIRRK